MLWRQLLDMLPKRNESVLWRSYIQQVPNKFPKNGTACQVSNQKLKRSKQSNKALVKDFEDAGVQKWICWNYFIVKVFIVWIAPTSWSPSPQPNWWQPTSSCVANCWESLQKCSKQLLLWIHHGIWGAHILWDYLSVAAEFKRILRKTAALPNSTFHET